MLWHVCKGLDEAAKLHFRESKLTIILASLRCQQFSTSIFIKEDGERAPVRARLGGGGLGERRGFSFSIPAPDSRVCLKGSAKSARKIMVCTENADQNFGRFQGL